jgi:hypothetical protein
MGRRESAVTSWGAPGVQESAEGGARCRVLAGRESIAAEGSPWSEQYKLVIVGRPQGLHANRPAGHVQPVAGQLVIEGRFEIVTRRSER